MAELDRSRISTRLSRLPGQLLLALINATTVLVIVAALLVLFATARIERFAGDVASTMTDAVLSKVDLPSKDVLADIRHVAAEVHALRDALEKIKLGEHPVLRSEIERLKDKVSVLRASIDRFRNARSILTEEALARLAGAVTSALASGRSCASGAEPRKDESSLSQWRKRDFAHRPYSMTGGESTTEPHKIAQAIR